MKLPSMFLLCLLAECQMSGLPGYQGLCCAELGGSRHGNLMLDALSMATLMRRNRWMRTETASVQSSEALGGPDAIGRVVDVRRCAGA